MRRAIHSGFGLVAEQAIDCGLLKQVGGRHPLDDGRFEQAVLEVCLRAPLGGKSAGVAHKDHHPLA